MKIIIQLNAYNVNISAELGGVLVEHNVSFVYLNV